MSRWWRRRDTVRQRPILDGLADMLDVAAEMITSPYRIGDLEMQRPLDGKIQITNHGEGGEFSEAELAEVIQAFVGERL